MIYNQKKIFNMSDSDHQIGHGAKVVYITRLALATFSDLVEVVVFSTVIILMIHRCRKEPKESRQSISYSVSIQLALLLLQAVLYITSNSLQIKSLIEGNSIEESTSDPGSNTIYLLA